MLKAERPGEWYDEVVNTPAVGGRFFDIPKKVQLGPDDVLLWADLPDDGRLIRGTPLAGEPAGAVRVFFPLPDPTVAHALVQRDLVDQNIQEQLRTGTGPAAAAVAELVARSGLAEDFADDLAWCAANHPDADARAAAAAAG